MSTREKLLGNASERSGSSDGQVGGVRERCPRVTCRSERACFPSAADFARSLTGVAQARAVQPTARPSGRAGLPTRLERRVQVQNGGDRAEEERLRPDGVISAEAGRL